MVRKNQRLKNLLQYSTEEEIVPDVDDLPNIEEEDEVTMSSPTAKGGIKIIKDLVKKTLK